VFHRAAAAVNGPQSRQGGPWLRRGQQGQKLVADVATDIR